MAQSRTAEPPGAVEGGRTLRLECPPEPGLRFRVVKAWLRGAAGVLVVLGLFILATERPAQAYTDPGSGALIWQMLVAGFVGLMFYGRRFLARFRKKDPKD
jgi:hypothetical protein